MKIFSSSKTEEKMNLMHLERKLENWKEASIMLTWKLNGMRRVEDHRDAQCPHNRYGTEVDHEVIVSERGAPFWKVGKNPMKDWRAAVRNWERGGFSQCKTQNGETLPAGRVLASGPSLAPKWGAK